MADPVTIACSAWAGLIIGPAVDSSGVSRFQTLNGPAATAGNVSQGFNGMSSWGQTSVDATWWTNWSAAFSGPLTTGTNPCLWRVS
jgi:hypothetical protein